MRKGKGERTGAGVALSIPDSEVLKRCRVHIYGIYTEQHGVQDSVQCMTGSQRGPDTLSRKG